ncbi:tetratricopeptide repeat protein [Cellvibrio sp.]|uniref:tetratricopeptide repeat protein n=1 Tax=Cellvibrio sp. TaxID=1965322 RepID=UPI0039647C73
MLKRAIALMCCIAVPAVEAQVRVVDSSPQNVRSGVSRQQESIEQKTESYNQIQSLLQEVSELRALVEEQGHEISRLKQLQLDNYVDLDRRVSFLTNNVKSKSLDAASSESSSSEESSAPAPLSNGMSEADEYKAAYDLLRQRQVDQSLVAFKEYLKKYPSGEFAANSCYWQGEIYLLKNQLPQAREWFAKLLQDFPDSNKVPDAKFKLGKVYHLQGDKKRAKPLLDDAASGVGDSARLAKQYLKDNF